LRSTLRDDARRARWRPLVEARLLGAELTEVSMKGADLTEVDAQGAIFAVPTCRAPLTRANSSPRHPVL
jgi:uncharacterized protein YjbI with pentapeptide repeats